MVNSYNAKKKQLLRRHADLVQEILVQATISQYQKALLSHYQELYWENLSKKYIAKKKIFAF